MEQHIEEHIRVLQSWSVVSIDELLFMRLPPRYGLPGKLARLYGLRMSPLLWQTKLTSALAELGFTEVPEEPCIMTKGGIICFFYVDDIVVAFRKKDTGSCSHDH
jgi:hypothetical protein